MITSEVVNRAISYIFVHIGENITVEEVENILLTYHQKFQPYFNELIAEIIPSNYLNKKVPVVDYVNTILKMNSIQNMDN